MPGLGSILGGHGAVEQIFIWGIVNQLVGAALTPYSRELENLANSKTQAFPLSPAELAQLVLRNYLDETTAIEAAKRSGESPDDFRLRVKATGQPLAPQQLAEALRRGIIPEDSADPATPSFRGGIRQGDIQDKWAPVIKALSMAIPSPVDALQALLEGQVSDETARELFVKFGGDPTYFQMLFDTRGAAPTPNEAAVMANRGIIPWEGHGAGVVSFEQAFLEGPWRNKWEPSWRSMAEYHPPPRTVTAMVRDGSLTDELALKLLKQQGLSDELAAAYLASAKHEKVAAHRDLSVSIIETLYEQKAITRADAETMIGDLGYDAREVGFILAVNDLKRVQATINRALGTIHTQYVNHKVTRNVASTDIDQLGLAADARDELLSIWDIERSARVALLTPTQVKKAAGKGLIELAAAIDRLLVWGYSADDAAIFMQL